MFSRTFGFLHFLFEHFLFTFSGAWKTTKAFFCLSFFVLRFIPFLLSHICKWCRGSFKLNGISQGLFILNAKFSQLIVSFFHVWFLLIYTRSSYIPKAFSDKSSRLPKVSLLSMFDMKGPSYKETILEMVFRGFWNRTYSI